MHGNAEEEAKAVFEKLKNLPNVTFAMLGGCISLFQVLIVVQV